MELEITPYAYENAACRVDMRLWLLRTGVDYLREQKIKSGEAWRPTSQTYAREVFNQSAHRVVSNAVIDTNYRNVYGDTCLHLFAHSSLPEGLYIIHKALLAGMAPGQVNQSGQKPLMIAALGNSWKNYEALRDATFRATRNGEAARRHLGAVDVLGLSALDYAVLGGATQIADDLVQNGIRPPSGQRPLPPTDALADCVLGPQHIITDILKQTAKADQAAAHLVHQLRLKP